MPPFVPLRQIIEFRRTQRLMPPQMRQAYRQVLDTPMRLLMTSPSRFPAFKLSFTLGYFGQDLPHSLLNLRNREGMSLVMGADAEHPLRAGRDGMSLFIEPRHLPLARRLVGNVPTRGAAKLERCRLQWAWVEKLSPPVIRPTVGLRVWRCVQRLFRYLLGYPPT